MDAALRGTGGSTYGTPGARIHETNVRPGTQNHGFSRSNVRQGPQSHGFSRSSFTPGSTVTTSGHVLHPDEYIQTGLKCDRSCDQMCGSSILIGYTMLEDPLSIDIHYTLCMHLHRSTLTSICNCIYLSISLSPLVACKVKAYMALPYFTENHVNFHDGSPPVCVDVVSAVEDARPCPAVDFKHFFIYPARVFSAPVLFRGPSCLRVF